MKFTIELDNYVVTSRGVECEVDCSKLSKAIVMELALHGLTQKIADAASQAKALVTEDTTIEAVTGSLMEKARESLYEGNWTRRSAGGGADIRTMIARSIVRKAMKAKLGAKSKEFDKFDKLEPAVQLEKLDANYEANKAIFDPAIDAEIERRSAANSAKNELAGSATFTI